MINVTGMSDGYVDIIGRIEQYGERTAPRGMLTREIVGAQIRLDNVWDNLPLGTGRKLNIKIAVAEAMQLIAGRSFPELMVRIAPNFAQFTNGGTWFHGAYGPRIRYQMPRAIDAIVKDHDTRQALVTIWDANYDGHGDVRDTPCTIALQWLRRGDELHAVTTMRSNDVWWGVPYDVYQFTMLQHSVAFSLGLQTGVYVHQAGSLHMYERDAEAASHVLHGTPHEEFAGPITWDPDAPWTMVQEVAECVLRGDHHVAMAPLGFRLAERLHA